MVDDDLCDVVCECGDEVVECEDYEVGGDYWFVVEFVGCLVVEDIE